MRQAPLRTTERHNHEALEHEPQLILAGEVHRKRFIPRNNALIILAALRRRSVQLLRFLARSFGPANAPAQ